MNPQLLSHKTQLRAQLHPKKVFSSPHGGSQGCPDGPQGGPAPLPRRPGPSEGRGSWRGRLVGGWGARARPARHGPPFSPPGALLSADMAESSSPPSSSAVALAPEPGVTEQPGPQSPPPSPPGLEEPLDGADADVPHPDLAPVAFFCLRQTTSPRNWCIKMVCNPYPLCGPARGHAAPPRTLPGTPASGVEHGGWTGEHLGPARVNILEVADGRGPSSGQLALRVLKGEPHLALRWDRGRRHKSEPSPGPSSQGLSHVTLDGDQR